MKKSTLLVLLLFLTFILPSCASLFPSADEKNYRYYDAHRWTRDNVYGPNYLRHWIRPGEEALLHQQYCTAISGDLCGYEPKYADAIRRKAVMKGMSRKQVYQSWGACPDKHNIGRHEVWRYSNLPYGVTRAYNYESIYFENGRVSSLGHAEKAW